MSRTTTALLADLRDTALRAGVPARHAEIGRQSPIQLARSVASYCHERARSSNKEAATSRFNPSFVTAKLGARESAKEEAGLFGYGATGGLSRERIQPGASWDEVRDAFYGVIADLTEGMTRSVNDALDAIRAGGGDIGDLHVAHYGVDGGYHMDRHALVGDLRGGCCPFGTLWELFGLPADETEKAIAGRIFGA